MTSTQSTNWARYVRGPTGNNIGTGLVGLGGNCAVYGQFSVVEFFGSAFWLELNNFGHDHWVRDIFKGKRIWDQN
jgi:hypothetical protein